MAFLIKVIVSEVQHNRDGRGREDTRAKVYGCGVPNILNRLPHLGFPHICDRGSHAGRDGRADQMGTKAKDRSLPLTITTPRRVSGSNIKDQNWSNLSPVPCVL